MSLIGPRPELVRYTNQYEGEEKDILKVRPGITDFSSVEFINLDEIVGGENADEMYEKYVLKKKNQLRIKYAHEVSFKTDVSILFRTLGAVLHKSFGFLFPVYDRFYMADERNSSIFSCSNYFCLHTVNKKEKMAAILFSRTGMYALVAS